MKKKILWPILVVFVLLIAGCSNESGGESESEGSGDPEENSDSKRLVIANGTDIVSFDIHDHNNTSTEAVHVNMFNYLVRNDAEEGFVSDLAENWENIDENTWTFTLEEGVTFHNGEELTAEDVKYTLERVANDDTLLEYGSYQQIEEVEILNDYEFNIHTHESEPALLNRLSRLGSGILPKDYIESEGWDVFLEEPVGSGPYKLKEWRKDDQLVLEPFEDYFGEEPKWEEVVFRTIPEDSTRVSEVLTGGADIAVNIPPTDIERIEQEDGVSIVTSPSQRVMLFALRTQGDYPTADPKVREAIDLAIDKEAIVDSLLEGYGTPTRTRVTPGNVGANEDLYDTQVYDPEKAKELLAEAGYENGVNITLSAPNGRYLKDKESVELMQAMLEEVGITAELEMLEWSAFSTRYSDKDFEDVFFIAYGNSMFDASLALQRLTKEQAAGETDYDNPETEQLLQDAMSNMDPEERVEQYQKAQEIIAEDRPQIYLYQIDSIYGVNDRVDFTPKLSEMLYVDEITLK
ncbi:peptide/nickel transport system substrate-binding protein [Lentibacillus halodurans]|uniref:Peptide/nickel transport system substrate-binding protein n=1 Tax=Lentibacillus halodurans TaxID=237679 RepID=A0A1I0YCD6_9BACI|nr:ABC transporter substrate-binding protein [Lentibacillus halodurans]SFB10457.1 peptide/nickel transport system substrate-binding protein [Lentibacillus halodurans]